MSIAFSCPECDARMEVPDEHEGKSGQCPRCQRVFTIPSANVPKAPAKAIPPSAIPVEVVDEKPRRTSRTGRREIPPPKPRGPVWPWLVGVPAVLAVAGILLSSLMVLCFYRKPPIARPSIAAVSMQGSRPGQSVIAGKLEGNRIHLANDGPFILKTLLTPADIPDPMRNGSRTKRFVVELQRDRHYHIDIESPQFDPQITITDPVGQLKANAGNFGNRKPQLPFDPPATDSYTISVTAMDRAVGVFTLTVRERARP